MNNGFYNFPNNNLISAKSASYSISSSYTLTASYVSNGGSGGDFVSSAWTGSSTSQFSGTASFVISSSRAISSSFATTASYVLNAVSASFAATASSLRTGSSTITSNGNELNISTPRLNLTGSIITSIFGNNGVNLIGTTTVSGSATIVGNLLPGNPITDSTSSWDLGSPTAAWENLYTSNIYFVSGSIPTTASVYFNNGNIIFTGSTVQLPPGSTVPTASFSQTSSTSVLSSTSSKISVTDTTSGTGPYYIVFTDGTTGARTPLVDSTGMTFNATANTLTVSNLAGTASFATTASYSEVAPLSLTPTFLTYTGVATASSNTALQSVGPDPVTTNAGFTFPSTGFYYFEFRIGYTSAATTTGAFFSLSGSAANSYLSCVVTYPTLNTDRSSTFFNAYDGGTTSPSTLAASPTQVNALITGHIRVTTVGTLVIRFASEVNASAITFQGSTIMYRKISN